MPLVAGPILLTVYLEQGQEFAARAVSAATVGIAPPLALYAVVFAVVSSRCGWVASVFGSWVAVLAADLALVRVELPATAGLGLAVLGLFGGNVVLRRWSRPLGRRSALRWWDRPARAAPPQPLCWS